MIMDKNQISKLREESKTLDRIFKAEAFVEKLLVLLEEEGSKVDLWYGKVADLEARITELDASLRSSCEMQNKHRELRQKVEAELAAAVPVYYEAKINGIWESVTKNHFNDCVEHGVPTRKLFTHPVLPVVNSEPVAWTSARAIETKRQITAFTDENSAVAYGQDNGLSEVVPLFTHPKPPVVVLENLQIYGDLHGVGSLISIEDLRSLLSDAGITVKSADGEGV